MLYEVGDILTVEHGVIVQQVNAQGAMNSGVAKAIRQRYPTVWAHYTTLITPNPSKEESRARLGKLIMVEIVPDELWVANIVGQQFYGSKGTRYTSYDALDDGFKKLKNWLDLNNPNLSVHHPLIGADRGGGSWSVIREIIEQNLGNKSTLWILPTVNTEAKLS